MAGNSLSQSCVFGHRAARAIVRALARAGDGAGGRAGDAGPDRPPPLLEAASGPAPADLAAVRATIRRAMTAGAGAVRDAARLEQAARSLDETGSALGQPAARRDAVELAHMRLVGRLMVRSAQLRTESRGVHWRDDHPERDPAWDGVRLRIQPR
jgi:L-aspartate oxidase